MLRERLIELNISEEECKAIEILLNEEQKKEMLEYLKEDRTKNDIYKYAFEISNTEYEEYEIVEDTQ